MAAGDERWKAPLVYSILTVSSSKLGQFGILNSGNFFFNNLANYELGAPKVCFKNNLNHTFNRQINFTNAKTNINLFKNN